MKRFEFAKNGANAERRLAPSRGIARYALPYETRYSNATRRGPQQGKSRSPLKTVCEEMVATAEACCEPPPFRAGVLAARHVCGNDGRRAERDGRLFVPRCTPLVSRSRMPACSHASEHVTLMLTYMCLDVCLRKCAMRTAAGECGDESRAARRSTLAHGHRLCMSWSRQARTAAVR